MICQATASLPPLKLKVGIDAASQVCSVIDGRTIYEH